MVISWTFGLAVTYEKGGRPARSGATSTLNFEIFGTARIMRMVVPPYIFFLTTDH